MRMNGTIVSGRRRLGAVALAAGLGMAMTSAFAIDDSQYPDFRGSWARPGAAQWDTTKPPGL